jgi:hypothetical protein
LEYQPNENPEFFGYLCFPYPVERGGGFYIFEAKRIVSRRRILIISPNVSPFISA